MQATEQKSQATDFEPDVWWGEHGIDALIWADARPYAEQPVATSTAVPASLLTDDLP